MAETEVTLQVILNGESNHDCQKGCQMLPLHHIHSLYGRRGRHSKSMLLFTFAISARLSQRWDFRRLLSPARAVARLALHPIDNVLHMHFDNAVVVSPADGRELRPMQLM